MFLIVLKEGYTVNMIETQKDIVKIWVKYINQAASPAASAVNLRPTFPYRAHESLFQWRKMEIKDPGKL